MVLGEHAARKRRSSRRETPGAEWIYWRSFCHTLGWRCRRRVTNMGESVDTLLRVPDVVVVAKDHERKVGFLRQRRDVDKPGQVLLREGNADDGIVRDKAHRSECLAGASPSKEEPIAVVYCSSVLSGCILDRSEPEHCRSGHIRRLPRWSSFYDSTLKRKELRIVSPAINPYIRVSRVMIKVTMENSDHH